MSHHSSVMESIADLITDQTVNFNSLIQAQSSTPPYAECTASKVRVRLEYVRTIWSECRSLHMRILQTATESDLSNPYFTEHRFETHEINFLDILSDLEELSSRFTAPPAASIQHVRLDPTAADLRANPRPSSHLPRIELPKFSGDYLKWDSFCDYFKSIIINDACLDNIRRFHYLKSCLEGEPLSMINHLTSTDENFDVAWNALEAHFSNKRCIIDQQLRDLFALPYLRKESANELRDLYHRGVAIVGALEALGEPVSQWNSILVHVFSSRLDPNSKKDWAIQLGSRKTCPTFEELKTFMSDRACGLQSIMPDSSRIVGSITELKHRRTTSNKSNLQVQSHATAPLNKQCPSCSGEHSLYYCKRFKGLPVSKRSEFIKKQRLCVNCFGSHNSRDCTSKHNCFICDQRHHTLLHREQSSSERVKIDGTKSAPKSLPTNTTGAETTDVVLTHFASNQPIESGCILLATAMVLVTSASGRVIRARALLDQGSTWTFISAGHSKAFNIRVSRISTSINHGAQFPLAAEVLRHGLYIDDCLFGANDVVSACRVRDQLTAIMSCGQFVLRKWASNSSELLMNVDPSNHGLAWEKPLQEDDGIKVLGVVWNPQSDVFQFKINLVSPDQLTKRSLLSIIARLYDPLGWVSPVVIVAKILVQRLWLLQLDWDSPLPDDVCAEWSAFYDSLPSLNGLTIPRWTGQGPDILSCSIHGFSDASSAAYAAVVYIRVTYRDTAPRIILLMSRSKVAPVKQLTIPRLELCAAVLLARVIDSVLKVSQFSQLPTYCLTDATIVLHWLQHPPVRWKTFVGNQVAEIQRLTTNTKWNHVASADNPADRASRGLSASALLQCSLWTNGPAWLAQEPEHWPCAIPSLSSDVSLEQRTLPPVICCISHINETFNMLMSSVSTWTRLVRIIAYMIRWRNCLQGPILRGALTSAETHQAASKIFQWLQETLFPSELLKLQEGQAISVKSKLASLNPFLHDDGRIRVGGRLKHTALADSVKHPILLSLHPIVRLLVIHTHDRCLHGGVQLTLRTLRQSVWIVQAKKIIRSVIHACVTCARFRATLGSQMMGNFPSSRVSRPERPFLHCGVDYAGPFQVRYASGRGAKSHLAYVALFVCFAVKAIHIELVSDCTSAAFIASYKRFSSRRGIPNCLYSDQGKTFVGAKAELTQAYNRAIANDEFRDLLSKNNTDWRFIPPASPHFGGLWEAGVKSAKFHLKRVLKGHTPTFEEMTTLLCEIECALNSRPLGALSEDIDNLDALTPGHFLIGGPLNAVPEESILSFPTNRLSRWLMCRQLYERFWHLWSADYVLSLQHRTKWRTAQKQFEIGQMVLLKRPNLPPAKWPLARIVKIHPGDDGLTRVVTVRTANTEYTRPLTQLALLPIDLADS